MDDVSFLSKVLNYNLSGFDLNLMATLVDKFTKAVITAERACRQSCFYYSCIHTRLMVNIIENDPLSPFLCQSCNNSYW